MNTTDNELHPMQLEAISVKRLRVDVWDESLAEDFEGDVKFLFQNGHGELNKEDSTISIGVRAIIGDPPDSSEPAESPTPFFIEVELFGVFSVDLARFQERLVPNWARMNAPYLLLPYVREQVYGLASRAGIKGLLVPLFVQPQFRPPADTKP